MEIFQEIELKIWLWKRITIIVIISNTIAIILNIIFNVIAIVPSIIAFVLSIMTLLSTCIRFLLPEQSDSLVHAWRALDQKPKYVLGLSLTHLTH